MLLIIWLITSNLTPVMASASGQASFSLNTASVGGLTGTVNLTIDGLSAIPGATASFSPTSITTSGASVLTVTTKSNTTPGTYPVTAIANSGNLTRTVTVSIVVPKTSVRLSSTSLTFAGQKVGTTSAPQKITATNTGSTALSISTIAAGKNFGETNTCGTKLSAGASCTDQRNVLPGLHWDADGHIEHFRWRSDQPADRQPERNRACEIAHQDGEPCLSFSWRALCALVRSHCRADLLC